MSHLVSPKGNVKEAADLARGKAGLQMLSAQSCYSCVYRTSRDAHGQQMFLEASEAFQTSQHDSRIKLKTHFSYLY